MKKDYWERRAIKYKDKLKATNNDPIAEELEYKAIISQLTDGQKVLDLGCGNGNLIHRLSKRFPNSYFKGYDSSKTFIKIAKEKKIKNTKFECLNVADQFLPDHDTDKYDVIIAKRLLINLSPKEQVSTLYNILSMMKPTGKYLMFECWTAPLQRIQRLRKILKIEPVPKQKHCTYLTDDFYIKTCSLFRMESLIDFMGLYYLISRVFNPDGKYMDKINIDAKKISRFVEVVGFAPECLYVWTYKGWK